MKITITALLALSGVALATPFTFTGPESTIKLPTAYDLSESWELSIEVCMSPFNASKVEDGYIIHNLDTNLDGTAILTSNDGVLSVFAPSNFKVNTGNCSYCNLTIGNIEASFATNGDGTSSPNSYMDTAWEFGSAGVGNFLIKIAYDSDAQVIDFSIDDVLSKKIENVDIAEGTLLTELGTGITQEQIDTTVYLWGEDRAMWGLPSVSFSGAAAPAVPEPTTATLSLLALAGLAARRRRK